MARQSTVVRPGRNRAQTITPSGLVLASDLGSAAVSVIQDPDPAPWLEEDFSTYTSTANFLSNPRGIYANAEFLLTSQMSLDTTQGYGASDRSLRYTWPDRSGSGSYCGDYTIGCSLRFPGAAKVKELWTEAYVKFSADWTATAPGCAGVSNSGYKFMHWQVFRTPGATDGLPDGRAQLGIGYFPTTHLFNFYPPGEAVLNPVQIKDPVTGLDSEETLCDGEWHRLRFWIKCSSSAGATDADMKVWVDDHVLGQYSVLKGASVADREMYGYKLGANINQGPDHVQTLNWGRLRFWNTNPGW